MSLLRKKRWPSFSLFALLTSLALIANLMTAILLTPGWSIVIHGLSLLFLAGLIATAANDFSLTQERQRVILEISREMARKAKIGDLLDYVVQVTLNLMPLADKCVIHLLDQEGQRLLPRYSSAPDWQQHLGLPIGKGIAGRALRENTTIVIDDVARDQEFLPLHSSSDLRALLVAPLKTQDKVLGTISLNSHTINAFTQDDLEMMTVLAAQISSSLQQALLHETAQREKHYVESVLMNMPDGIAVVDDQDRLARYNVALAHILGTDTQRLIGKPVSLDSEELGLRHLAQMMTAPDPNQADVFTQRLTLSEPVHAILDATVSIIKDHNGQRETIVVVRDETPAVERIRAEADLMTAAVREIMPGLSAVSGYAALLRGSLIDQPGVSGWAAEIQTKSSELIDRARDLDFLRALYANEIEVHNQPARLNEMLPELGALVQPLLDDKEMSLKIELEGAGEDGIAKVLIDQTKLAHALRNVMANAIHRGYRGGQINLCVTLAAEDATITVADNGRHLQEDERQRIFYSAFRMNGANSQAPAGTGLSLYVARSLIEVMGGHLWLEQDHVVGVKISMVLPMQPSTG